MTGTKSIFQSKTVAGLAIAGAGTVAGWFGIDLPEGIDADLMAILQAAVTLLGLVIALYGRVTAKEQIVVKKAKKA